VGWGVTNTSTAKFYEHSQEEAGGKNEEEETKTERERHRLRQLST